MPQVYTTAATVFLGMPSPCRGDSTLSAWPDRHDLGVQCDEQIEVALKGGKRRCGQGPLTARPCAQNAYNVRLCRLCQSIPPRFPTRHGPVVLRVRGGPCPSVSVHDPSPECNGIRIWIGACGGAMRCKGSLRVRPARASALSSGRRRLRGRFCRSSPGTAGATARPWKRPSLRGGIRARCRVYRGSTGAGEGR